MVGTIKATKEVAEAEEVVTDKMTKIHTAEVEVEVEVEDRRVDMGAMIRTLTEEVCYFFLVMHFTAQFHICKQVLESSFVGHAKAISIRAPETDAEPDSQAISVYHYLTQS